MHAYVFLIALLFLGGCAKNKTKDTMNAEELATKAHAYLDKSKFEDAVPYVQELVARFPDHPRIGKYKILLAELHFKAKDYGPAKELYEHFSEFFPADKHAEYARYKSILAVYHQLLPADCDQSPTEEAIRLCTAYLQANPTGKYATDVQKIMTQSQNRLLEAEMGVFDFYLRKNQFEAARKRLAYLRTKAADNKAVAPQVEYLAFKLALREKKTALAQEHLNTLLAQYHDTPYAAMASNLNNRRTFSF